jgi:uncharacterized protein YraI
MSWDGVNDLTGQVSNYNVYARVTYVGGVPVSVFSTAPVRRNRRRVSPALFFYLRDAPRRRDPPRRRAASMRPIVEARRHNVVDFKPPVC